MLLSYSSNRLDLRKFACSFFSISGNQTLLDIGCGHGIELEILGNFPDSQDALFIGIDLTFNSIQDCRTKFKSDYRHNFIVHDVDTPLPFPDKCFDYVYSRDLLECVTDKVAFLKDVSRIMKDNGKVVFVHYDWDTIIVDGSNKNLVRKIVHLYCDLQQKWMKNVDGWMGRRLWSTFQKTGCFDGQIFPYVIHTTSFEQDTISYETINDLRTLVRQELISEQEYMSFYSDIERLANSGQFYFALTSFIYVGRKRKSIGNCS